MPIGIVKTKEDEKIWDKAKEIASSQGREDDFEFISGIFKRIKSSKENSKVLSQDFDWSESDNEIVMEELMQQVFPSPGGKYRVAKRFAGWFPKHTTYTEAFAGGLACYFNKEQSEVEVINDMDPDIAGAYKFVRNCSEEEMAQLKNMKWDANKEYFYKLKKQDYEGKSDIEKFYRYMYLIKASYGGNRQSFGYRTISKYFMERLPQLKERLSKTKIYNGDYAKVLKKYDSKNTFHYLDPPYPDEWPGPESKKTRLWGKKDVEDFVTLMTTLEGKFMVSLNNLEWIRKMFEGHGWYVMTTPVPRTFRTGMKAKYELLVTNYKVEGEESDQLKKADNQIIVNSDIKKLSEMIYSGKECESAVESLDAIVNSLDDYDLVLKRKISNTDYSLREAITNKDFEKNIIEKLPNGERVILTKNKDGVEMKNSEGLEVSFNSKLKKEMQSDPRDYVIEGYLFTETNEDVILEKHLNQVFYTTNIFYLNEDISSLSSSEKKKYLKTISFSAKFRLNPFVVVENNDMDKATKLFAKSLNSNGSIVRDYDGHDFKVIKNDGC